MSELGEEELDRKVPVWAIFLCILVPIVWVINLIALACLDYDARGTFGDMFGAANSLFTGAALAALIVSIFFQKHEVSLAKRDLRLTRETLAEQQRLTAEQQRYIEGQSFENTFFSMMSMLMELVNNIDLDDGKRGKTNGKDVFHIFVDRMKGRGNRASELSKNAAQQRKNNAGGVASAGGVPVNIIYSEAIYEEIYGAIRNDLGHYFRVLYNLLKFLKSTRNERKDVYVDLLRAQLSDDELIIIFLNGLSGKGEKMKPLIEEFGLLKHIDVEDEIIVGAKGRYSGRAYE